MIIDGFLLFDGVPSLSGLTGVAQFASGATTNSTNTIDLLNARDIGDGLDGMTPLIVEFLVTTAYAGGASVNFQVQGSVDNVTWTTYSETGAIPIASLTQGQRIKLRMPMVNPDTGPNPRYLRTAYGNVGVMTAGSVITWLGSVDQAGYYPPGITVNN
jgi:hypothetical protein